MKIPRRQMIGFAVLWLFLLIVIILQGGSLIGVALVIGVSLVGLFILPVIWLIVTGKELLSDLEDFRQERLIPLLKELEVRGVETVLLDSLSDKKRELEPPVPFKAFERLAQIQLTSREVDFIHIGYWTDSKVGTEAFNLDFTIECEIEDEARVNTELSMMKRFVLFGRRSFRWWGRDLAQSLNQDEALKENLVNVCKVMEMPALWVVPDVEERAVRIHIPYVKRVDPEQFPSILAVAERIAQHIKSLA
jgi:hypothetical protein